MSILEFLQQGNALETASNAKSRGAFYTDALAALWQTSLTMLSVEIEGHPLGGGMLKLEPTEAENVLPGEKAFQGGLGPKKVDVSYADERHGLMLAVSVKSITSEPYGKNLKNRFYDLCPEGIALHLRFPYSVVCALFCFPFAATLDITQGRKVSTFERARKLLSTIRGRKEYTDPVYNRRNPHGAIGEDTIDMDDGDSHD